MNSRPAKRRTVLAAVAAAAGALAAPGASAAARTTATPKGAAVTDPAAAPRISHRAWSTAADWASGTSGGTRVRPGSRPAVVLATPQGTVDYRDPHTGRTGTWEWGMWTSAEEELERPATETVLSWNAHTPGPTWIRAELRVTYSDGGRSPWYTMGIWTSGDGDDVPRRTSVDGQADGRSSVSTDTLALDDPATGLRITARQVRLTLYRAPGSGATPAVWRAGAMSSDVPDRFEVPASEPGVATGHELPVPRYSQEIHKGRYPEYDGGGEAWCSPTSSQMILEYWGRKPTPDDLAWVDPAYDDPQVCHAARHTYDHQYEGCGNWPFNAAYAATWDDMRATVTRLESLRQAEELVAAGLPLITSQSFVESELDGAGYGTAGHLMTVIGFTRDGDVIANDPASPSNDAVRRVYPRRQFENIWLRTKRKDEKGQVKSATGGVCYIFFPLDPAPTQHAVLRDLGIL